MSAPTVPTRCPSWCDPRSHVRDAGHASTPVVIEALADDVEVEMAVRLDGASAAVSLGIRSTQSMWPGGAPVEAEGVFLPAEAEVIGHRLIALAAIARDQA